MKFTKKLFSIILCFVMVASLMVVAVPANARTYAIIEFSGLDMPVPNERPDFEVASLCDDYGMLNYGGNDMIIWIDEETGNELEYYDSFVAGHNYRVKIYFEPTSNQVEIVEGAKFMMDGTGLGWYIYQDSNGMYAQYYFDTCGQIKDACIYIDEPAAGAKPDFEAKYDNRFVTEGNISPVKNGVSWYDLTDEKYLISGTGAVFEAGHQYKVIFDLRSYTCDFDGNASINVNRYKGNFTWAAPNFATVEYTFAKLDPPAHTCAPKFVSPTPPTCTKQGHVGYYRCSCGEIYWDEKGLSKANSSELPIPPTGHVKVTVPGKKATYLKKGLTAGAKCSICNTVLVKQKTIAKKTLGKVTKVKVKSSKKRTANVTWKKVKDASGYIVEYSTSKKFTKKTTKKTTIKKGTTLKVTLKKLKSKKKYYVKIRAFKKVDGKKVYGKYSSVVSAKVK